MIHNLSWWFDEIELSYVTAELDNINFEEYKDVLYISCDLRNVDLCFYPKP